jgi:Anaerobic c4-dicarboxylate membrane transporter
LTRHIGAKAIREWFEAWGKERPQHIDVPLVVEITPDSSKKGIGMSKVWSDADWAAYRDAASKERRNLQQTVLAMIFLSTFVVWGLEVALNIQPVFNDFRLDSVRLDLGISDTNATVIVVGLLTVVAALSIALAASRGGRGDQPPRELAAAAVWGNAAANASYLAAMTAMVTGLTQIFAPTKPALIIMLLGMGVIAAIVAAAVRSWIGRELERRIERENELEAVEVSLRALHASAEKEGKVAPVNPPRAYSVFLVVVGMVATLALVGLTLAFRAIDGRPFVLPWALLPAGLALAVLITWPLIVTTISLWVAHTQPERLNRWQAHLSRSVVVGVVSLNWIAALYVSRSVAVDVTVTAVFLIVFVIPAFCLLLARDKPRGPAAFAFFRLITIAEKNRARVLAEDERAHP